MVEGRGETIHSLWSKRPIYLSGLFAVSFWEGKPLVNCKVSKEHLNILRSAGMSFTSNDSNVMLHVNGHVVPTCYLLVLIDETSYEHTLRTLYSKCKGQLCSTFKT